jgi:hypothetical protein
MEERYGVKSLAERDRDAKDRLDCFNFRPKPLAPDIIETATKLDFQQNENHTALDNG